MNPDTVMKAYRELELRGVTAGRPGVGTFIMQAPDIAGLKQLASLPKKLAGGGAAGGARRESAAA